MDNKHQHEYLETVQEYLDKNGIALTSLTGNCVLAVDDFTAVLSCEPFSSSTRSCL